MATVSTITNEQTLLNGATLEWLNELAAVGILTTDAELRIRSWNHWLATHSGRAADTLLGQPLLEVFPELVTRRLEQYYRDALAGQVRVLAQSLHHYLLPMRSPLHDPAFPWMQQSARIGPLIVAGKVVGTITVLEDVTERVAREAELRHQISALEELQQTLSRSEKWLATTLHSIADGVLATDLQNRVFLLNKVAQTLTGWPESEAQGRPLADVFQVLPEAPRERLPDPLAETRPPQPGANLPQQALLLARDGTTRAVEQSVAPITDEQGKTLGAALIFRDISTRREAEQEIERRYRNSLQLTETNRALVGALEFEQVTEITCRAARELVGADGATFVVREGQRVRYAAEDALAPLWQGQTFPLECCISGWVMLHAQPAVIEDIYTDDRIPPAVYRATFVQSLLMMPVGPGLPVGAIGVYWADKHRASAYEIELLQSLASAADLALASVRAYAEARHARTQAEQANRLKDEFLATLSHELRNPLNSIVGNAEMLLRAPEAQTSPFLRQAVEVIRRNAHAQTQLINDLLDLSRLQNEKLLLKRQPLLLAPILRDAAEAVRLQIGTRNIEFALKLADEALVVEADPVRLQQILWNLLSNAVKFTPNGGRVSLSLHHEAGAAVIRVTDTGQGIEAAFLPHIFEMFRQADARTTRQYGGLGIGLALVKQLTELHEGSIQASSKGVGQGAEFTVRLPLVTTPQTVPVGAARLTRNGLAGARILIVDDSPDSLEMLQILLAAEGAQVTAAASGLTALQLARAHDFDLVVSDISMPEMDGYELLQTLRAEPRFTSLPAIALTGFGRPEDIARVRAVGFTSHLTKPIDLDYFLELARLALHKAALPAEAGTRFETR